MRMKWERRIPSEPEGGGRKEMLRLVTSAGMSCWFHTQNSQFSTDTDAETQRQTETQTLKFIEFRLYVSMLQ